MADHAALEVLAASKYIRLTTFRRDGTPVPTPVWLVRDGDHLWVTTTAATGKIKRLRHTPRVLIAPSDMRGRVAAGALEVEGVAEIRSEPADVARLARLLKARYGLVFSLMTFVERRRRVAEKPVGVALRISV